MTVVFTPSLIEGEKIKVVSPAQRHCRLQASVYRDQNQTDVNQLKAAGSQSYPLVNTNALPMKINWSQTEAAAGQRTKRADEYRDLEQENAEGKIRISVWNQCRVDIPTFAYPNQNWGDIYANNLHQPAPKGV